MGGVYVYWLYGPDEMIGECILEPHSILKCIGKV